MKRMNFSGCLLAAYAFFLAASTVFAASGNYLATDWQYQANNYINKVSVADLNGDGVNEVIASSRDGIIYDLGKRVSGHVNWQTVVGGDVRDYKIIDYNKDGKYEVLSGSDKTGVSVRLLNWQGLNDGSTIDYAQRVYSIDAGDVDGDGVNDIIIGSADHRVYVLRSKEMPPLWEYAAKGAVQYVKAEDIDSDSRTEVIALSSWAENEDNLAEIYALDEHGKPKWNYSLEGGAPLTSNGPVAVVDINGDGKKETIAGGYNGVTALDPAGQVLWQFPSEKPVNVVYASFPLDTGKAVIYVGATPYVYALSGVGALLWKFPVNTTVLSLYAADIDSDGRIEVLAGAIQYIHVLKDDGTPIISWSYKDAQDASSLAGKNFEAHSISSGDVDGDGAKEVVAGFGWTEGRVGLNYYSGLVEVFTVNLVNASSTSTLGGTLRQTTTLQATTQPPATTTSDTQPEEPKTTSSTQAGQQPAAGGNFLGMFLLVGLGLIILVALGLLFLRGKKPPGKKEVKSAFQ